MSLRLPENLYKDYRVSIPLIEDVYIITYNVNSYIIFYSYIIWLVNFDILTT
jgi:hypothetical protein